MFDALAADLPEGHPGGLIPVFQEDCAQFQEGSLVRFWWWCIVGFGRWLLLVGGGVLYCDRAHGVVLSDCLLNGECWRW